MIGAVKRSIDVWQWAQGINNGIESIYCPPCPYEVEAPILSYLMSDSFVVEDSSVHIVKQKERTWNNKVEKCVCKDRTSNKSMRMAKPNKGSVSQSFVLSFSRGEWERSVAAPMLTDPTKKKASSSRYLNAESTKRIKEAQIWNR